MGASTVWSFGVRDARLDDGWLNPDLARIIFFHLPCALLTTVFFFAGGWFSLQYLLKRLPEWDVRAAAAFEIGTLYAVLTMVTGVLFSKVQWGAWWQWDPRQTSFLLVLLILAAYFALRAGFGDEGKRAANSAAYGVSALLPAVFLIFVFPRLEQVRQASFHPSTTIQDGKLIGEYRVVLYSLFFLLLATSIWIYRLRVRAGIQLLELEASDAELDDRGRSTATGVVRPVRVPDED
jgi:heme exporter protein C